MPLPLNTVVLGDCLEVLRTLPDASVDAVVTDPPAGIEFMNAAWDSFEAKDRTASGKQNASLLRFQDFLFEVFEEVLRVLKPGGHALVWSIPRTSHHTGMALERANFEVRDCIHHLKDRSLEVRAFLDSLTVEQQELLLRAGPTDSALLHCFGSGFPKSLNIGKAIDKAAGAEREVLGQSDYAARANKVSRAIEPGGGVRYSVDARLVTAPATDAAKAWDGWGTALKPAVETWWLCRKPIEAANVASQVLATGTGALNIDGCRDGTRGPSTSVERLQPAAPGVSVGATGWVTPARPASDNEPKAGESLGRWPSNLVLSHAPGCERVGTKSVKNVGPSSGVTAFFGGQGSKKPHNSVIKIVRTPDEVAVYECAEGCPVKALDEQSGEVTGGASRFFNTFEPDYAEPFLYTGKASKADKNADLDDATPMMELREDLTEEDRAFVLSELRVAGVVP